MKLRRNALIVIFLIFHYISKARVKGAGEILECVPGEDYRVDCNRCWCVMNGIMVCDKINCGSIPKKFWAKIKLTEEKKNGKQRGVRVVIQAMGKFAVVIIKQAVKQISKKVTREVEVKILPNALDAAVKAVKNFAVAAHRHIEVAWQGFVNWISG